MRSVVVVLPASMCAMIPMLRVFSSVYLRGISDWGGLRPVGASGEKNGPLGSTRAAGLVDRSASLSDRGLHLGLRLSRRSPFKEAGTRATGPTIAEDFGLSERYRWVWESLCTPSPSASG